MMSEGPSLAELRAELYAIENRRRERERAAGMLGAAASNIALDVDLLAEIQREELAAERARVAELQAAIAAAEAELPNSPQQLDALGRRFAGRRRPA